MCATTLSFFSNFLPQMLQNWPEGICMCFFMCQLRGLGTAREPADLAPPRRSGKRPIREKAPSHPGPGPRTMTQLCWSLGSRPPAPPALAQGTPRAHRRLLRRRPEGGSTAGKTSRPCMDPSGAFRVQQNIEGSSTVFADVILWSEKNND